jgi:hypothetical protein
VLRGFGWSWRCVPARCLFLEVVFVSLQKIPRTTMPPCNDRRSYD